MMYFTNTHYTSIPYSLKIESPSLIYQKTEPEFYLQYALNCVTNYLTIIKIFLMDLSINWYIKY